MSSERERLAVAEAKIEAQALAHENQLEKLEQISTQLAELNSAILVNAAHTKNLGEGIAEAKQNSSLLPNMVLTAVVAVIISSGFGMLKGSAAAEVSNKKIETSTKEN